MTTIHGNENLLAPKNEPAVHEYAVVSHRIAKSPLQGTGSDKLAASTLTFVQTVRRLTTKMFSVGLSDWISAGTV